MQHIRIELPKCGMQAYVPDLMEGIRIPRRSIVICPGGGYVYCSPREGEPVALRYASKGFHAFILRYSVGWDAAGFAPLQEVSWVIGYLREHADEWHINPSQIATCGFSAGGHVAFAAGLMGENKPNAMILGYPAVTTPNHPMSNFMVKLLTGKKDVTDEDCAQFSLENYITKNAPPVFMMATAEDGLSPFGALLVANTYSRLGLPYELHMFQHGPHGYSLADETSADGSSQVLNSSFAQWHSLSVDWLYRVFGQLTFSNESTSRMGKYMAELGLLPGQASGAEFA